MLETLAVVLGLCIILYLVFWAIERSIIQLRPCTSKQSKRDNEYPASAAAELVGSVLGNLSQEPNHSFTSCDPEVSSICAETTEVVSALGEGVQSLLEGTGEHLGSLGEHLGNIISGAN